MDTIERAVVVPEVEVAMYRAARRQVLRQCSPLAARAQDIHQAIDDFADIHPPLVAAALGRRNLGRDQLPLFIRQVTRVAQLAAVVATPVLRSTSAASCKTDRLS